MSQSCKQEKPPIPILQSVRNLIDTLNGDFAVAYLNLASGERLLIRENETFHAASTMKTPVMIEAFNYIKHRHQKMTDSIEVYNRFFSIVDSSEFSLTSDDDGDPDLYQLIGQKIPWTELIHRMIVRSSNLATNILIDFLGAQNVTRSMRDLGAKDIQVLRGVEDIKAYEAGLSNTTTAYDLMMIYENLANYRIVDSVSSQTMIDILLEQEFNSLIPALLPDDVKVAHKTGWITGVHHDSGIVFLPDGQRYVLILLSKNVKDMEKADESLSAISRFIYDHVYEPVVTKR